MAQCVFSITHCIHDFMNVRSTRPMRSVVLGLAVIIVLSGFDIAAALETSVDSSQPPVEAETSEAYNPENPAYIYIGVLPGEPEPTGRNGFYGSETPNPFEADGPLFVAASAFAAAYAAISQDTAGNSVTLNNGYEVSLENSVNAFHGLAGFNMSAGVGESQANVISIAGVSTGGGAIALLDTSQTLIANRVFDRAHTLQTRIEDSFNNTSGVVGINQSAGALNQQINAFALAFSIGINDAVPAALIGDAELAAVSVNKDNEYNLNEEQTRVTRLSNSFNNFTGVAQISQTAGSLNQVSNKIGITMTNLGGF